MPTTAPAPAPAEITEHEKSLEKQVAEANVVEQFLADETIKAVIQRLGDKYYGDFLAATTPEALTLAKARADVIRDFAAQLRIVMDRKPAAELELQRTNPKRVPKK